jgi:hypothetical protein
MPSKRFKIEKVPLSYLPVDHHPVFPPFPILYLELIENKEKVQPALKNKTEDPIFLPNVAAQPLQNIHPYVPMDDNKEFFDERDIRNRLNDRMKRVDNKNSYEDRDRKSARDRLDERHRDELRAKELSDARKRESRSLPKEYNPSMAFKPQEQNDFSTSSTTLPQTVTSSVAAATVGATVGATVAAASQEDSIRSFLGGTAPASSIPVASSVLPPTLSEINTQANINAPVQNLSYTDTTSEIKRKRDLLFRFDILRKSYKDATIPEFSEYTDLATMEQIYEDTVRKVGLDSKVEGYKKFLTMGFFGVEFLFTNIFKVDMSGFAKQQLSSMNSYERILIELGEKAMIEKSKSQWPAEIRLLFTIVMNAVIFLLMKNVMSGGLTNIIGSITGAPTGGGGSSSSGGGGDGGMGMMSGLMNMMSGLGGGGGGGLGGMMGGGGNTSSSSAAPKKGKMKGPSVNLD